MLKQSLQQKLLQKLSPQQIQLMKLLQIPTTALEQRIKQEIEENPALEEGPDDEDEKQDDGEEELQDDLEKEHDDERGDGDEKPKDEFDPEDYFDNDEDIAYYKLNVKNTGKDDDRKELPMAQSSSFQEILERQLSEQDFSDPERQIAEYLLGNIDDDGYLQRDLESTVDDIAFSLNTQTSVQELENILKVIQKFDPPGVGARNLQECLLLQLEKKYPTKRIETAIRIIKEFMQQFSRKHYEKIAEEMGLNETQLKIAIDEILKLNPKPGNTMNDGKRSVQEIVPDFIINNNGGELELILNSRNLPDLRVANVYKQMLNEYEQRQDKTGKEAAQFVKQKIENAKLFIDTVRQRSETLYFCMKSIMDFQKDFFLEGDEKLLKPMVLKDVSAKIGMDISTISRVSNSKYVQTPFGTYLLKYFFSEALTTEEGEEVSSREVKQILRECVETEDKKKPLTDDALTKILKKKGYNIARRTVAKYREMLEIPVARLRKQL